ncbi:DNA ligase [Candidatus Dependentiae bacterium]|nr:DNA ligase [Candidatus Dependentiae bacterium]
MKLSHKNKIWFPQTKITKENITLYYQKIAPYFLKYCKNHLMVLLRYPNGIDQDFFYQKQIPQYFPAYIKRKTINLKKGEKQTLVVIANQKSLLYLVNQATITFHSWLSNTKNVNNPDKIVFDFDPSTNDLKQLRFAVTEMKKIIENYNLVPFLMTTGSKGYHIVIPIKPEYNFDIIHKFTKKLALELVNKYPKIITKNLKIKERNDKIFIDYLRNSYGQTSVAAYSVRAIEKAPIATPIEWKELNKIKPQQITINTVFKRLKIKGDVWKDFEKNRKKIDGNLLKF